MRKSTLVHLLSGGGFWLGPYVAAPTSPQACLGARTFLSTRLLRATASP